MLSVHAHVLVLLLMPIVLLVVMLSFVPHCRSGEVRAVTVQAQVQLEPLLSTVPAVPLLGTGNTRSAANLSA